MRKQGLPRQARGNQVGVVLRVALPGADDLELEGPRLKVIHQHAVFEFFDAGERVAVNLVEAPQVAGEGVRFAFDRVATQVLEKIVVGVHAIERGVRGMRLVEIAEQVVDKVWKRLGSNHRYQSEELGLVGQHDPPMVQ